MNEVYEYVHKKLLSLGNEAYKKFHQRLIPTVPPDKIIGVRTPVLRRFAREFGKTDMAPLFLSLLPHRYYDEDNLHAFLIEQIKDFDACADALNTFLPYVDNWATCDMMSPKILASEPEKLLMHIDVWISSRNVYEVRFVILCLMRHFLDSDFNASILNKVSSIVSDEYYINMARAWFFATALAFQWNYAFPYIRDNRLDTFTHNKTIQKAVESFRITKEQKRLLKGLKKKVI